MSWLSNILKWFAAREPALTIDQHGWLVGEGVTAIAASPSWYGGPIKPTGVVCHVSATDHGTALNMARRRTGRFDPEKHRLASWHASIEFDGGIVQMVPFTRAAWHAGSNTAKQVPGLGWANYRTVGLELVGWEKGPFPPAQVEGYARVLAALVKAYGIERRFAMITHASIDPGRRSDPGRVWMTEHADHVLDRVFGA